MVIGVETGTSSSKGVLVDRDGRVVTSHVVEHDDLYALYRALYPSTAETVHALARRQER